MARSTLKIHIIDCGQAFCRCIVVSAANFVFTDELGETSVFCLSQESKEPALSGCRRVGPRVFVRKALSSQTELTEGLLQDVRIRLGQTREFVRGEELGIRLRPAPPSTVGA
jgi:hypothetical protein